MVTKRKANYPESAGTSSDIEVRSVPFCNCTGLYTPDDQEDVIGTQRLQQHVTKQSEVEAYKEDIKQKLKQFDRDFQHRHGRLPTKQEKEPVRHLYKIYQIFRDQQLALDKEQAYMSHKADLEVYMEDIKAKLKNYDAEFQQKHGRIPTKADKEPVRHLYKIYSTLKKEAATLEKNYKDSKSAAMTRAVDPTVERTFSRASTEVHASNSYVSRDGDIVPSDSIEQQTASPPPGRFVSPPGSKDSHSSGSKHAQKEAVTTVPKRAQKGPRNAVSSQDQRRSPPPSQPKKLEPRDEPFQFVPAYSSDEMSASPVYEPDDLDMEQRQTPSPPPEESSISGDFSMPVQPGRLTKLRGLRSTSRRRRNGEDNSSVYF